MSAKSGGGEGTKGVGGATKDLIAGPVRLEASVGAGTDNPTVRENRTVVEAPASAFRAGIVWVGAPSPRRCRGRFGAFGGVRPGSSSPLTGDPVVRADFLALLPSL